MPPYNSILNQSWYDRLTQNVREGANAGVRATGSQPDDPFWMARQAQGLGDLQGQRNAAMTAFRGQAFASQAAANDRDAAYQRYVSRAMAQPMQANAESTFLTAPQGPAAGDAGLTEPMASPTAAPSAPAPAAYEGFMSKQALMPQGRRSAAPYRPYKPSIFDSAPPPALNVQMPTAPAAAPKTNIDPVQKIAESLYSQDTYAKYDVSKGPRDYYAKAWQIYNQSGGRI